MDTTTPTPERDKTRTSNVCIHIDLSLTTKHDAAHLRALADEVVTAVAKAAEERVILAESVRWTAIVPAEGDFDWQEGQ